MRHGRIDVPVVSRRRGRVARRQAFHALIVALLPFAAPAIGVEPGAGARDPAVGGAAPATTAVYNCEGRNSETASRVYGTCQNRTFAGPDATTGNIVFGRCVPGGAFEATDSATAQKVTGTCDAAPRPSLK